MNWLNEASVATQAIATAIDTGFAGGEIVVAIGGCVMSIEAGCIGGALEGILDAQLAYKFWGNFLEQGFSFLSLGFTILGDLYDDGQLGESSENSAVTFVAGQLTSDPFIDSAIDIYALGYSTGKFNSIETIMNGGGLIRK